MPTLHEANQQRRVIDKQYSILIVDAMASDRQQIRTVLSNSHYRVVEAQNGEEALQHLSEQAIDVVLLDTALPGMDGFEVCEKLRRMQEMQGIPVVMLVSDGDGDDPIKGIDAGATDFLLKPIRSGELMARLSIVVEGFRLNAESSSVRHIVESTARSQTALLTMLSREIRTPLNTVLGLSHLGLHARAGQTFRNYFERINFSAWSLLNIMQSTLDFSRLENGGLKLSERGFNVRECLMQVDDLAGGSARDKELGFQLEISDEVPEILHGDAARLRQVLINLTHAAVKLIEKGKITLQVTVNALHPESAELLFTARGAGENSRWIERLSEWVSRADRTGRDLHEDRDSGLAPNGELIIMMQGCIWVDRQSDEESSFYCAMRLRHGQQIVNGVSLTGELESAKERLKSARVLIVEDNSADGLVLRELLEAVGAGVVMVSKAQDALDRLASAKFDAVIINPRVIAMDDTESVRCIRAMSKNAQLRIIEAADSIACEDRDRYDISGIDDFLPWIASPGQIYRTLAKGLPEKLDISVNGNPEDMQSKPLPVDISVLHQMFHNNAALVRKFGLKFVEVANDALAEMNIAQAEKDLPALGRLGHKLKSSARTIGASSFADLCEKLEKANLNNNWSNAESLLKQIPVVLTQITQQLEQEFQTMDK